MRINRDNLTYRLESSCKFERKELAQLEKILAEHSQKGIVDFPLLKIYQSRKATLHLQEIYLGIVREKTK